MVYISVLNWNSPDTTIECLRSLQTLDYPRFTVIVVDNASSDASVERIRAAYPDITLLRADTNLGYAGGNALALEYARHDADAELFWIVNNDARVLPDTLTHLVDAYRTHGDALYGSVPVRADGPGETSPRVMMKYWEGHNDLRLITLKNVPYARHFSSREPRKVRSLSGSSLLIPLRVVSNHNFIDTNYFLYGEDLDYSFRLHNVGIPSILVPASLILHADGGTRVGKSYLKPVVTYYQTRGHLVFAARHLGKLAFLMTLLKHIVYVPGWLVMALRRGPIALQCAYFTARGIVDALRGKLGKTYAPEDWVARHETTYTRAGEGR